MIDVLIALGGNIGHVEVTFSRACLMLSSDLFDIQMSKLYQTAPVYDKPGAVQPECAAPTYTNAVFQAKTWWDPHGLMQRLLEVEAALGRVRPAPECSPRTIDLDLLLYGDQIIVPTATSDLQVPHPRMHQRQFVLEPACDIAPDWIHPELGLPLKALLDALLSGGAIRAK